MKLRDALNKYVVTICDGKSDVKFEFSAQSDAIRFMEHIPLNKMVREQDYFEPFINVEIISYNDESEDEE